MFGFGRASQARKSVDAPTIAVGSAPKSPSVVRPNDKKFSTKRKATANVDDTMNIDWVSDKAAKACVMCEKRFHTFKRRRHHCRQCGRVVCNACSMKRLVLQADHFQGPQRVCDGCFFTLSEKKQAKQHASTMREKEEMLLNATSYISESLLRVFLLDGSSVTVSYDDCSTAGDLTERICFSVRCALFEVQQDIRDRDQFALVHSTDTLVDMIARWTLKASTTVKLVLPLYDLKCAHTSQEPSSAMRILRIQGSLAFETQQAGTGVGPASSPRAEWEDAWHDDESSIADSYRGEAFSVAMEESGLVAHSLGSTSNVSVGGKGLSPNGGGSSTNTRNVLGKPSPLRLDSDPHTSVDAEDHGRGHAQQLSSDKLELQALQKKYDLLKNIHSRQTLHRSSLSVSNIASGAHLDSVNSAKKYRGESYDLFDEKSFNGGRTSPVVCAQDDGSICDSSFFENENEDDSCEEESPGTAMTAEHQARGSRGLFGFVSKVATSLRSPTKERSTSKDKASIRSTSRDVIDKADTAGSGISPIAKRSANNISAPLRERSDSNMSTSSVRPGPEMILLSPKDIQSFVYDISSSSADFQQIVRTFFHQASSVENFMVKFHSVIRTFMSKEEHSLSKDDPYEATNNNAHRNYGRLDDTEGLTNVFEMTWALEGLYAFVLGVAEEWSNEVRSWLLVLFRKSLSPPIARHARLKCITQCLQQMELLHLPQAVSTIQGCVDRLFDPRTVIPPDRTPTLPLDGTSRDASSMRTSLAQNRGIQALEAMRLISYALSVLGDDLLPAFPVDVGLLNMCLLHTTRIVRSDVFEFFNANKQALSLIDVLTILSFAERQRQTLSHIGRLGTDLPILQELEQEALRTYLAITDSNLRQVISRVHAADERAVPQEVSLGEEPPCGLLTNWPSELLSSHGEQFASVSRYVQPKTREVVWTVILDSLPDFVLRQKAWISKISSGNTSATSHSLIERLCAHINNHQSFADELENKLDRLSADLDDATVERVTLHYHRISALFTSHAEFTLQLLIRQVVADLQKSVRVGLFRNGWDNSVQVVHTSKRTLMTHKTSLFAWLRDAQFASIVISAAALAICDVHVELLLTSGMTVTANFLDRLQEDFNLWQDIFQNYIEYFRTPADLLDAQNSWRILISALSMDTRNMQSFVRNDMFPAFGVAAMKVWFIIMQMRGDSKQVVDTLVDAILSDWNPKAITPKYNTQPFITKLKSSVKLPHNTIFI